MIARVGLCDVRILAGLLPVELAGLNDDAAECCAVTAQELCCGVYYDVCTVLERSDQVRCAECIVYYYRQTVFVSDLSDGIDIRDIRIGVAECLEVDGSCVLLDGALYFSEVVSINESCLDAVLGKSVA